MRWKLESVLQHRTCAQFAVCLALLALVLGIPLAMLQFGGPASASVRHFVRASRATSSGHGAVARGFSAVPRIEQVLPVDDHKGGSGLAVSRIILIRHGEVSSSAHAQELKQTHEFHHFTV